MSAAPCLGQAVHARTRAPQPVALVPLLRQARSRRQQTHQLTLTNAGGRYELCRSLSLLRCSSFSGEPFGQCAKAHTPWL